MVGTRSLILGCAVMFTAFASPLPNPDGDCEQPEPSTSTSLTADTIIAIDPRTANCDNPVYGPAECADASEAAPAIQNSFTQYKIDTPAEQAALIALMLFETGGFKANKNHVPGLPGQGTRNMQSPDYNSQYAQAIDPAGFAKLNPTDVVAVLDLANSSDDASFGSAAWFYSSKCSDAVKTALKTGSQEGWTSYLVDCIGTAADPLRDPLYAAAKKALGVAQ